MRSPRWPVPFGITEAVALRRASGCRGRRASRGLTLCGWVRRTGGPAPPPAMLVETEPGGRGRPPRPAPAAPHGPPRRLGDGADGVAPPRRRRQCPVQPSHRALSAEPPAGLSSWLRGGGGGSLVWCHHPGSWELGFANRFHRSEPPPPRGCSAEAWEGLAVC